MLWAKSAGGTTYDDDIGYSVSTDPLGNVYVSGACESSFIVLDTDTFFTPSGGTDPMFIAKYNSSGNVLCASILSSGGDDNNGVASDAQGNAYIVGDFIPYSFIVGNDTLINKGLENIFVAKFSCDKVGINEQIHNEEIIVYPNPASSQFVIETNITDKLTVDLYDVNGRHVFSRSISDKANMSVGGLNLSDGIYSLRIKIIDQVINKKLIVMH